MNQIVKILNALNGFPNATEWSDEEKIKRGFNPKDCCGYLGVCGIAPTENQGNGEHILQQTNGDAETKS